MAFKLQNDKYCIYCVTDWTLNDIVFASAMTSVGYEIAFTSSTLQMSRDFNEQFGTRVKVSIYFRPTVTYMAPVSRELNDIHILWFMFNKKLITIYIYNNY